jgi:hypothetical protein
MEPTAVTAARTGRPAGSRFVVSARRAPSLDGLAFARRRGARGALLHWAVRRAELPYGCGLRKKEKMVMFSSQFLSKFHYAKKRFSIISKYRQMHKVLNINEIKN